MSCCVRVLIIFCCIFEVIVLLIWLVIELMNLLEWREWLRVCGRVFWIFFCMVDVMCGCNLLLSRLVIVLLVLLLMVGMMSLVNWWWIRVFRIFWVFLLRIFEIILRSLSWCWLKFLFWVWEFLLRLFCRFLSDDLIDLDKFVLRCDLSWVIVEFKLFVEIVEVWGILVLDEEGVLELLLVIVFEFWVVVFFLWGFCFGFLGWFFLDDWIGVLVFLLLVLIFVWVVGLEDFCGCLFLVGVICWVLFLEEFWLRVWIWVVLVVVVGVLIGCGDFSLDIVMMFFVIVFIVLRILLFLDYLSLGCLIRR